jgi:hypothetical protein
MPREAREKAVYSTYYLYQEGSNHNLFRNDEEKNIFLEVMGKTKKKYNFKLYAFCLNDYFYKLIIFDNGNDITKIMKSINISYTMKINRIRQEKGKIFDKRFISRIIDKAEMLLEFSKNIHLDSKELKECHSSYCAYFKEDENNNIIDTDIILKGIVSENKFKKYQMYINSEETLDNIVCEYNFFECVDNKQCLKDMKQSKEKMKEILEEKNITFEDMLTNKKMRNELIKEFRKNSILSLKEIGEIFGGISESGICKILSKE